MEAKGHSTTINVEKTRELITKWFDTSALPALEEYVRIPNLSKAYDPEWNTNGLLEKAAKHLMDWATSQSVRGLSLELIKDADRSPMIYGEVPGSDPKAGTILFYGHFDKQPHFTGWKEGLGPVTPVIQDGKLYGRGASDDGYSLFATILSIKAIQEQGLPHARCVLVFEGDEESGTGDLEHYFEKLKDRVGKPDIMVILDSGALSYDELWITTSLRGVVNTTVTVDILTDGVHSGNASGLVPSSFRIMRQLVDRVDCSKTGVVDERFHVNIPADRYKQSMDVAKVIGDGMFKMFPFVSGGKPTTPDPFRAYLNRVWLPQLSIVGADGLPPTQTAGNVLRASTTLKLSLRIPPTLDAPKAAKTLEDIVTKDAPYGAKISVKSISGSGWNAPTTQPWLENILESAGQNFFKRPPLYMGEGGSIPFLNFLGNMYPTAQFITTGVLGPHSNAHGPNEFLELAFTKKLICCITQVVGDAYKHLLK